MPAKIVSYKRAVWLDDRHTGTLEANLRIALRELPQVAQRKVPRPSGQVLKCLRHGSRPRRSGISLHIVAETPGDPASIIHARHDADEHGDVAITPAPAGTEFMDGDIFAFVDGDNVCICTTNLRDTTLSTYIYGLFERAGLDEYSRSFEIQPVGDADKLRLIARGVKKINLGATVHAATVSYARRRNETRDIIGAVGRELQRLIGNDVRELEDNLQVNVEIYSDGRLRNGVRQGERRLERLARDLIDGQGDDYTIITKDGQSISQSEVFIRTKVNIDAHGKSLSRESAWSALREVYASLQEAGITEE